MSIPVPPRTLEGAVDERGSAAFVLTVSDRGTPHVVNAEVVWSGGGLTAVVGAGIPTPTRAVLHRSAPAPDPAASLCGSDCIPLSLDISGDGRAEAHRQK